MVLCVAAGCSKSSSDAPPAPGMPWQPHGLRIPDVHCVYTVPPGWTSGVGMPDHIAELRGPLPVGQNGPVTVLIVEERVEPDLPSAQARVLAYWRSGLATAEGARVLSDAALDDAGAPAHLTSLRWGKAAAAQVQAVALVAFPGLPVLDVVANYAESDTMTAIQVQDFVRGLRCTK